MRFAAGLEDEFGLERDIGAVEREVRVLARFGRNSGLEVTRQLAGRVDKVADAHGF